VSDLKNTTSKRGGNPKQNTDWGKKKRKSRRLHIRGGGSQEPFNTENKGELDKGGGDTDKQ